MRTILRVITLILIACTTTTVYTNLETTSLIKAQLNSSAETDSLTFKVKIPSGFKIQQTPFNLNDFRYFRVWVRGRGITDRIFNSGGFVGVGANFEATLSIAKVPKGKNRVVTAQAYDLNQQPIPGTVIKAVYSSIPGSSSIIVYLHKRFFPLGNIFETLLDQNQSCTDSLNATTLQAILDQLIYNLNPIGGNVYNIHPELINSLNVVNYLTTNQCQLNEPDILTQATPTGPVVTSFNPGSEQVGNLVTVTGQNFNGIQNVVLNGLNTVFNVLNDSTLTFTVPVGATTGNLVVTNSIGNGSKQFPVLLENNGNLKTYLLAINLPLSNTDAFIEPSAADMTSWRQVINLARQGQANPAKLNEATALADTLNYDGVKFTHTDATRYFILQERPGAGFKALGTYVFDLQHQREIVWAIPHPIFDNALDAGIDEFIALHPRVMMFAGSHRCTVCGTITPFSGVTSVCNSVGTCNLGPGTKPFRIGDVAHYNNNFYHQAHEELIDIDNNVVVFSVHGASDGTLGNDLLPPNNQLDAIISEGVNNPPLGGALVRQIEAQIELAAPGTNVGIYSENALVLGGTTNLQGRYHNSRDIFNTCVPPACTSNGLFIHLEQDITLRTNPNTIITALTAVFP